MPDYKYLTEKQLKALFKAIESVRSIRDILMFRRIYRYGLRIREAIALELERIHPDLLEIGIWQK